MAALLFSLIKTWLAKAVSPTLLYLLLGVSAVTGGYFWHVQAVHAARLQGQQETEAKWQQRLQEETQRSTVALAAQQAAQEQVVAGLRRQLIASEQKAKKVRVITKEIVKYVTPSADAHCTVPAGFVYVYNTSLRPATSSVPDRAPGNADAPSGIALSTVASIAAGNNAECEQRGAIIDAWQQWYRDSKVIFDRATQQ